MGSGKLPAGETNSPKRLYYIDILNILSCFAVLVLHCSNGVFDYQKTRLWFIYMFLQTVAHFAVPVFIMITGANLLDYRKKYDTKTFFKKRAARTLIPFFFWQLVYFIRPFVLKEATEPFGIKKLFAAMFNNEANYIFWFFYCIFAIYMCLPLFSLAADKKNIKTIEYVCVIGFVFLSVVPLINEFAFPVFKELTPPIVKGYLIYVLMGWLIKNKDYTKKARILIYISGIFGAALMFFGTYIVSEKAGKLDDIFMDYPSIACLPMSAAVFTAAKYIKWERLFRVIPEKFIRALSSLSLGIYVTHMLVLYAFDKVAVFAEHPVYCSVFMPFIAYIICAVLSFVIKKIPILKHIMP